jgi:hypothetical protein
VITVHRFVARGGVESSPEGYCPHVRMVRWILAVLVAVALVSSEAAAALTLPEAPAGQASPERYEVFLAPPSSLLGSFETKVGYETASGQTGESDLNDESGDAVLLQETLSSPPTGVLRLVLTTNAVAAVSIDGGAPIPTIPAVGPPYEWRSAVYAIPGVTAGEIRAGSKHGARVVLTALNASGQPIDESPSPQKQLPNPALETRSWETPAPAARGVCKITADRFPGLTAQSGGVVSVLRPLVGAIGQPYLTCASTEYVYRNSSTDEWSLVSFMVLDAQHPGVEPAAMPAMEPVAGYRGVLRSRITNRELVGRRIPGAWLLVEGGRDLGQRLTLLANLSASVHLQDKSAHRRAVRKRKR